MADIAKIVQVDRPSYDQQYGTSEDGECFQFLNNTSGAGIDEWKRIIEQYTGPVKFGIADEAYGFYEDMGISFPLHDHVAIYFQGNSEDLQVFWAHYHSLSEPVS
jgi:hypothetical protein